MKSKTGLFKVQVLAAVSDTSRSTQASLSRCPPPRTPPTALPSQRRASTQLLEFPAQEAPSRLLSPLPITVSVCPPLSPHPPPSLHSILSVPLPEPLGQAVVPPAGFWREKELPCGPPSRTPLRSLFALQPGGPSLPPGPESGVRGPAPRPTLCTDAAAEHIALQTRPEQLGGARPSARLHVNIWADVIPAPLNAVN